MGKKILKIEKIKDTDFAYDVSVNSTNHTFELDNGVFVHNSWKIPKQYFGETDDSTGFNGGTSLSIISSRYAKTVKRIQSTITQMLTDAVNILLIDRGLDSYVNKFTLHMQAPVTQEELDKRDALSSKVALVDDVMRMLDGVEDPILKLKILKELLSDVISDQEVIQLIQKQIDQLEEAADEEAAAKIEADASGEGGFLDDLDLGGDIGGDFSSDLGDDFGDLESEDSFADDLEAGIEEAGGDELPTPADLGAGLDFTGEM